MHIELVEEVNTIANLLKLDRRTISSTGILS